MAKNRSRGAAALVLAATAAVAAGVSEAVVESLNPVQATGERPKSIRSLVMGEITKGTATKEIAVMIHTFFPGTAADTKSTKHIAWYRSRMKKDAKTAASAAAILES